MDGIIKLASIPSVSTLAKVLTAHLPDLLHGIHAGAQGGQLYPQQLRIISCVNHTDKLTAHIGIFFDEITAGCNCNDAPSTTPDYCEVHIHIDKPSAHMTFARVAS
ncbi:MAG: hypothetical protein ABL868_06715 [Sulfuriferula sp.]